MNKKVELRQFRASVKHEICEVITSIYKKQNNGILPNFENDEEIYVDSSDIKKTFKIGVEVTNCDDSNSLEKWEVSSYVRTLDDNLFFICDDNEIEWVEVSTDELFEMCVFLQKIDNDMK